MSRATAEESPSARVAAAALLVLLISYIVLCVVVLHKPEWLPHRSILHASLVGPPHWLVWGQAARPVFWGATFAIGLVATVGASFRALLLPCAGLGLLIWAGAGFMSVAMSV